MTTATLPARIARPAAAHPVPGDTLLHPIVLLAIVLLVANDHVLKSAWPGFVTGKLSDFAGLLFFPLLLQAVWEVGASAVGRPGVGSPRLLIGCIAATAVVFSAIQLMPAASDAYRIGLGTLQWLAGALPSLLAGDASSPRQVALTPDPTDLIALPVLLVTFRLGMTRACRATFHVK